MLRRLRSDNQRLNVDYNTYRLTIYRLIFEKKEDCCGELFRKIESGYRIKRS